MDFLPGNKILDVGCGAGRDAKYFIQHGYDVTGVDLCPELLKIAREKAPKARFEEADLSDLAFPSKEFDGIWSCASFLHIPKYDANLAIQGFLRVLKPQGILYISTKEGKGEKLVEATKYGSDKKRLEIYYSQSELEPILSILGFDILESIVGQKGDNWLSILARKQ